MADLDLTMGHWRARFGASGALLSLSDGRHELVHRDLGTGHLQVRVGRVTTTLRRPVSVRREENALVFEHPPGRGRPVAVDHRIELDPLENGTVLHHTITVNPSRPLREDVTVWLPWHWRLPSEGRRFFIPRKDGLGEDWGVRNLGRAWAFHHSGIFRGETPDALAIPLMDEWAPDVPWRAAVIADPYFGTHYRVPTNWEGGALHWGYRGEVGLAEMERRDIWLALHTGGPEDAMRAFYATAMADVPPGPDWLHDTALIVYDFLSEGGRGWFRDIDRLAAAIAPADRAKVALALHGWYDMVGRYSYDIRSGALDREWTAFPRAAEFAAQMPGARSTPMTIEAMHQRIRYATERGFRVVLYFADGLGLSEGATDLFSPDKVLSWGGWRGPDSVGQTCQQNPCHPEVRAFYLGYLDALLETFGDLIHGLNWDETFFMDPGAIGPDGAPGYVPRAMMALVKECTARTRAHRADLAFLASDNLGLPHRKLAVPYALVADGCWQDSHCAPVAWPYGLFPNLRNVLWSCNWRPVTRWAWTRHGVERYGAPIILSHGSSSEPGPADMDDASFARAMDLFETRKNRPQHLRWLRRNSMEACDHAVLFGPDKTVIPPSPDDAAYPG